MADRLRFRRDTPVYPYGRWRMNEHILYLADEATRADDTITAHRLREWVRGHPARPSSTGDTPRPPRESPE